MQAMQRTTRWQSMPIIMLGKSRHEFGPRERTCNCQQCELDTTAAWHQITKMAVDSVALRVCN